MPDRPTHIEVVEQVQRLLRESDLPEPDAIEHHPDEVVLLWHGPQVALVVELDELPRSC